MPLPNFDRGSKTGQGSWNWGITTNCRNPQNAMQFWEFLLQTDEVLAMTNANGAVPGTKQAIDLHFIQKVICFLSFVIRYLFDNVFSSYTKF